ncbi:7084_t:CDS:2, partial [Scutellospora calospora]
WRTTLDIQAEWSSILSILDQQRNITKYAGPEGWNDPDMLEIGNDDLTLMNKKKSPKDSMTVVLNTEIIAINQDPLRRSVDIVEYDVSYEIWTGPLIDSFVAPRITKKWIELVKKSLDFTCSDSPQKEHGYWQIQVKADDREKTAFITSLPAL